MKKFIMLGIAVALVLISLRSRAEEQPVSREQVDEWGRQSVQFWAEKKYADAIRIGRKAADQGNAWAQNNVAWTLATCEDAGLRDGKLAVFYALKAVEQEPRNYAFVRTLAAAYARNSQFGEAIAAQKTAMNLFAEDRLFSGEMREKLRADNPKKLELYGKHEAYVDAREE